MAGKTKSKAAPLEHYWALGHTRLIVAGRLVTAPPAPTTQAPTEPVPAEPAEETAPTERGES
jgi:hypothetical protein